MKHRQSTFACMVVVALLAACCPGCFGRFELTRIIWRFNRGVSNNRLIQWVVFLAFAIFPVYAGAITLDTFFFNVIQFWSGSNILSSGGGHRTTQLIRYRGHRMARLTLDRRTGTMMVALYGAGSSRTFIFERLDDGLAVRRLDGRIAIVLRATPTGGIAVTDRQGQPVTSYSAKEVATAQQAFDEGGARQLGRQVLKLQRPEAVAIDRRNAVATGAETADHAIFTMQTTGDTGDQRQLRLFPSVERNHLRKGRATSDRGPQIRGIRRAHGD